MEKKPEYDFIFKGVLLITGIVIGFICFQFYNSLSPLSGVVLVAANIIIVSGLYFGLRAMYNSQYINYIKTLTENVRAISDGEQSLAMSADGSAELHNLYEAIEVLRDNLKHQNRTTDSLLKIVNTLTGNIELEKLLEELLPNLIECARSNWGAFYLFNPTTNKLEIKCSLGFSKNIYKEFDISLGEGFLGKSAQSTDIEIITDIPEDTVFVVRTFLGKVKPRALMTIPIVNRGDLVGMLVIASIHEYTDYIVDTMALARDYVGVAVTNCLTYERTQRLTSELKFQNQLIQNMNDELEDKVKERTDFLDSIINSIQDYAIIAMDKDGFITKWNKGAEAIRGYTQDEIAGKHISETYGDDELSKIKRRLDVAKKDGRYMEYGWHIKKDGTKYYADIVITAMHNRYGDLIGFTNITKDITAMKNLEQALIYEKNFSKTMLENSTRALLLADFEGNIISINDRSLDILAKGNRDFLAGKSIYDLFADPEAFKKTVRNIIRYESRKEWEAELAVPNGDKKLIVINATALNKDDSESNEILFYLS